MIWPFPFLRGYKANDDLTRLFLLFANAPDVHVEFAKEPFVFQPYYATATCSVGVLRFWIKNRGYAETSSGSYKSAAGYEKTWDDEMPSRWAVKKMMKLVDKAKERDGFKLKE